MRARHLAPPLAAALLAATPAAAEGPVTLGSASTTGVVQCSGTGTTLYVQDAVAADSPGYAASAGVITSWSVGVVHPGSLKLDLVRRNPDLSYTVLVAGPVHDFDTPGGVVTVPARIVVPPGGASLALYIPNQPSTDPDCIHTGAADDKVRLKTGSIPDPQVGDSVVMNLTEPGYRLNVSAVVEPDADGDGYGDLTQDLCPSRADLQTECAPPETTASAPRKKLASARKAKVKVRFASSEAGSTFRCTVDGRAKACAGSKLRLRLRVGRHHITVAAVDPAGNADPTPARLRVKVVRRS